MGEFGNNQNSLVSTTCSYHKFCIYLISRKRGSKLPLYTSFISQNAGACSHATRTTCFNIGQTIFHKHRPTANSTLVIHYLVFYLLHIVKIQMTALLGHNEGKQGTYKEQPPHKETYPVGVEYSILHAIQDSGTGKRSSQCPVQPFLHQATLSQIITLAIECRR